MLSTLWMFLKHLLQGSRVAGAMVCGSLSQPWPHVMEELLLGHPVILPLHFILFIVYHTCNSFQIQLLQKLSQCLAILESLTWHKSNKLANILKIISIIV